MGRVCTPNELTKALTAERDQGLQIGVTNGCFDLMHVGHLRYLQAAREETDRLVVLVNTDASVHRLKGPTRPILPEDQRAELLAGLACVDYVCLFDEPTPVTMLQAIHPDVYIKGGDYTEATLPEAPALKAMGTAIRFVPFIEGQSTTGLIARIQSLADSAPTCG
ncbi:MAG: adenylyltransferase/cytidyltransferase family protein [Candidatus Melainabacteria bacterium]